MMETVQAFSQTAAAALIAGIWQGALLAAMIWVCMKFAPQMSAAVRFIIWSVAFAAIMLLPLAAAISGQNAAASGQAAVHPAVHALALDSRWAVGLTVLWAIFVAVRIAILARNAFSLRSLRNRSNPVETTPAIQSILRQARYRTAEISASPDADQPCVIGFLAPRILVPEWLAEKATNAELEQIVLHEVSHLRRFDDWTNLLQKLILAIFPLNPALHWVERRLCAEREVACDESVVRATNAPREYATCLTNLAEQRLSRYSAALSLGAWEGRSQLASRIENILRGGINLTPLKSRALLSAFMLATVAGAVRLAGSAQLVSFTSPGPSHAQIAQADPGSSNGAIYHDAVFHEPSLPTRLVSQPGLISAQSDSLRQPHLRAVAKKSLRRASSHADGVPPPFQSLIIVTRWQNASGQQVTVIDRVVRISALSAAQPQSGWFVVPL